MNDKLLITYFCLYILLYMVSRSYFKILESLLKFAVSFDVLIWDFRTHTQIVILEIYILPSISMIPFVKFMVRSKDLVSLKMLRLTLPGVTF